MHLKGERTDLQQVKMSSRRKRLQRRKQWHGSVHSKSERKVQNEKAALVSVYLNKEEDFKLKNESYRLPVYTVEKSCFLN